MSNINMENIIKLVMLSDNKGNSNYCYRMDFGIVGSVYEKYSKESKSAGVRERVSCEVFHSKGIQIFLSTHWLDEGES